MKSVLVQLDNETLAQLDQVAPPRNRARSEFIRRAIKSALHRSEFDRIRESFHEQGFLEARVRTRRTESEDARSVALEFLVNRGPRTLLELAGFVPSSSLRRELEEAWHKNVFDQFLIDDLTHRVRYQLVTTGELGNVVVGTIDRPDPETKRLRIEVTPGAPVTGREIRFVGNSALDRKLLDAAIVEAGIAVEAWLDRAVVERAVRQVYNEEGFLKAEVIGEPLIIEDSTGVLVMVIKEGPRAQITDVKWAGVGEPRLPGLQKAAAISPPAPYVIAEVNDALLTHLRTALEIATPVTMRA